MCSKERYVSARLSHKSDIVKIVEVAVETIGRRYTTSDRKKYDQLTEAQRRRKCDEQLRFGSELLFWSLAATLTYCKTNKGPRWHDVSGMFERAFEASMLRNFPDSFNVHRWRDPELLEVAIEAMETKIDLDAVGFDLCGISGSGPPFDQPGIVRGEETRRSCM